MGRRPSVIKETLRQRISRDLRKKTLLSIRDTALGGIKEIIPRIHRIVLSGNKDLGEHYTWEALAKAFNSKLYHNKKYKPSNRGNNYHYMCITKQTNFQINFFLFPFKTYFPPIQVEIHPRRDISLSYYKTFLIWLNILIPGLTVSKIEYTIDQHCRSPLDVENLFWVELKSLYIPYQKTVQLYGGEKIKTVGFGKKPRTNFTCMVGTQEDENVIEVEEDETQKRKSKKHSKGNYKFYERGNDENKKNGGWTSENINRVRLEHTANREELVKNSILTLSDFIRNPKFFTINKNIWHFKRFKNSKKLIQDWETGKPFQIEYVSDSIDVKNRFKYIEDVPQLSRLKSDLLGQMKKFDIEWQGIGADLPDGEGV